MPDYVTEHRSGCYTQSVGITACYLCQIPAGHSDWKQRFGGADPDNTMALTSRQKIRVYPVFNLASSYEGTPDGGCIISTDA